MPLEPTSHPGLQPPHEPLQLRQRHRRNLPTPLLKIPNQRIVQRDGHLNRLLHRTPPIGSHLQHHVARRILIGKILCHREQIVHQHRSGPSLNGRPPNPRIKINVGIDLIPSQHIHQRHRSIKTVMLPSCKVLPSRRPPPRMSPRRISRPTNEHRKRRITNPLHLRRSTPLLQVIHPRPQRHQHPIRRQGSLKRRTELPNPRHRIHSRHRQSQPPWQLLRHSPQRRVIRPQVIRRPPSGVQPSRDQQPFHITTIRMGQHHQPTEPGFPQLLSLSGGKPALLSPDHQPPVHHLPKRVVDPLSHRAVQRRRTPVPPLPIAVRRILDDRRGPRSTQPRQPPGRRPQPGERRHHLPHRRQIRSAAISR